MSPLLSFILLASADETMLSQAQAISSTYAQEIAKAPPPKSSPDPEMALSVGSIWFEIKREDAQSFLSNEDSWGNLRDIGAEAIQIKHIRKKGWLGLNPSFERSWYQFTEHANKFFFSLVGNVLGVSSIAGSDFKKSLENDLDYQNLYHLVEIKPSDWNLLPLVPYGSHHVNIPWLDLQSLYHRGYVPEKFKPYVKTTSWNATDVVVGVDGKARRWIYLKNRLNRPVFDFLSPSYGAYQILSSDALKWCKELGTKLLEIDGSLPLEAQEMLCLWIRKIGGYSASKTDGTLAAIKQTPADLTYDIATRDALLHALLTQDASALKTIYRLYMHTNIDTKKLIHVLQPLNEYVCDWNELASDPKKLLFPEEKVTREILNKRLLKEDVLRFGKNHESTAASCARALKITNFSKHKEEIQKAHLLLAFTYAMQPGAFTFSYDDLFGTLPKTKDEQEYLYSTLPTQMQYGKSFALRLQKIIQARSRTNISSGKLIDILPSKNPGTLLLLYFLPYTEHIQLLAVNFADTETNESIQSNTIVKTNAIDLLTDLMEEKIFSSSTFSFNLPPRSGKAYLFRSREYE